MKRSAATLAAFLLLLAVPLFADIHPDTQSGFAPGSSFSAGDIDNVNTFNGGLTLSIPLGISYPVGGGMSYGLKLVYNSNPWFFNNSPSTPTPCSNAGLGWRVSLGRVDPPCMFQDDFSGPLHLYEDPSGADHIFYATLHEADADDYLDSPSSQITLYTRDGTYLRMTANIAGGGFWIDFPDGSRHTFDSVGRLIQMRDAFGNFVQVSYATPGQWVITDSQNRTQRIYFRTDLPGYSETVDHVDLTSFGGTTARYQLTYQNQLIGRGCGGGVDTTNTTVTVPLLVGLTLPDNSAYTMAATDYVTALPAPGTYCTDNAGTITAINLPTLGRLEWAYQSYTFPPAGPRQFRSKNSGVQLRAMRDRTGALLGVWTYTTVLNAPPTSATEIKNSVTDPLGNRTDRYFSVSNSTSLTGWSRYDYSLPFTRNQTNGALNLSSQVFNASGTLLRSEYVLYERDQVNQSTTPPHYFNTNRRLSITKTVFNDDGGQWVQTAFSNFDGLGHYRNRQTTSSFPGSAAHTHFGDFNAGDGTYSVDAAANTTQPGFSMLPATQTWVLGTMDYDWDNENGAYTYRDHCYQPGTQTEVRRRTHRQDGASQADNDLVAAFNLSSSGDVQSEKYYGGDLQRGIPTATGAPCLMALPASPEYQINHTYANGALATSSYPGQTFKIVDRTIDATGLASASRDTAGISTSYEYDAMGRLTWIEPSGGDGWTEMIYTPANPATNVQAGVAMRRHSGASKGSSTLSYQNTVVDYFGRVYQEDRRLPGGSFNLRQTLYDNAGNKASVSETVTTLGQASAQKTQFLSYDPFGRPQIIHPADGTSHDVTLSYLGARVVNRTVKVARAVGSETNSTTTEEYDAYGRLYHVTEPSGPGGAAVATTHGYDMNGNLISASTPSGVTQTRSFAYDRAGLLQSETFPEMGPTGNGAITYDLYDSRGHLRKRTDSGNDLTFTWDGAERLTQVRESTGTQRVLKTFTYATANGSGDSRLGKLSQQSRFNYVTINGTPFTVEIRELFTYGGRQGRVSAKALENYDASGSNPLPTTPSESFSQTFTYDPLGRIQTLGYPQCTHAACAPTAANPRTIQNTFTEDLLSQVGTPGNLSQYASSITYFPNLMINQVVHFDGTTDTQANDPVSMRRPQSITTTSSLGALWATGTYAYDGAGNVKTIGSGNFVYDAVSRLTSGTVYLEPVNPVSARAQSVTYDTFGNILSITTNGSLLNTPTDAATNRLSSASYGGSGNLTAWNGNSFTYDSFHNVWDFKPNATSEWIYLYTVDDERVWSYKIGNTSQWTLRDLGGKVLREYFNNNGVWSLQTDYIYRDGLMLAAETTAGTRHFHLDHLGTPRLVTNGTGAQAAYHVYYPFGQEATAVNQDGIRQKFTGHERDLADPASQADDFDYMHARHYSMLVGRFLQVDPSLGSVHGTRQQTWNRYSYVLNNPMKYVDPYGELWFNILGQWTYLPNQDEIYQLTFNQDGTSSFTTVKGLQMVVTFNGGALTLYGKEGSVRVFDAVSGVVDRMGRSQPALQGESGRGPIPEGKYYFDPSKAQSYALISGWDVIKSMTGLFGTWPGRKSSWGDQRVELFADPANTSQRKTGFFIHGGDFPGSAGCIDLCHEENDFFAAVGSTPGLVPLFVAYP